MESIYTLQYSVGCNFYQCPKVLRYTTKAELLPCVQISGLNRSSAHSSEQKSISLNFNYELIQLQLKGHLMTPSYAFLNIKSTGLFYTHSWNSHKTLGKHHIQLAHTQRETQECIISTVATDVLVLNQQIINSLCADLIVLGQFHTGI